MNLLVPHQACTSVFLEEDIRKEGKVAEILALAEKKGCRIVFTRATSLHKITNSNDHQGVACDIDFKPTKFKDIKFTLDNAYIYIHDSTYEQNVGAIIRTAECAGLAGVILSNKINLTGTIARISTGAMFHIPVIQYPLYQAIKDMRKEGFKIYGIERGGKIYFEETIISNALLIIGGEDKSLSEEVRNQCDEILEIPQFGKINSLNMSNASSIVIFEYIRQNYKGRK